MPEILGESNEEQEQAGNEAAERENDAAFDALDIEPDSPEDKVETGEDSPKEETEASSESDSDNEGAAEKSDTDSDELRKARANLVLEGDYTETELDSMPDEQKLRLAKRAVENRAKYTRVTQEVAELKRLSEQETAEPKKDSENADPFDVLKTVEPHLAKIREEFGDEYAKPLAEIVKSLSEELGGRATRQEEALRVLQTAELHREYVAALADHTEKWDLKDESRLLQVQNLMKKIDNPEVFKDLGSLMSSACVQLFGEDRIREVESNLASEHKHRANGQSTVAGKRSPKPESTPEDDEDRVLDAIFDGDQDQVRKISRKMDGGGERRSLAEIMSGTVGDKP